MNEPTNEQRENLLKLIAITKGKLRSRLRKLFAHPPDYRSPKERENARRNRRAINDLRAAAANYSGWCAPSQLRIHLF